MKFVCARCIQTPQLKDIPDCFDENDQPLYTVLSVAWDGQDLIALLSNRLLIVWRLRSREKFQFRQRVIYRLWGCLLAHSQQAHLTSRCLCLMLQTGPLSNCHLSTGAMLGVREFIDKSAASLSGQAKVSNP